MTDVRHKAFTLIELVAVLVLVGLMASVATLSLRSAYHGSQMRDVISRIAAFDQMVRASARSTDKAGVIHIDPGHGTLEYTGREGHLNTLSPVLLPAGYQFKGIQIGGVPQTALVHKLPCSTNGQTPSYTLSLIGPKEQQRLLVFAGLTGQITEFENTNDFDLKQLLSPRPDAD